MKYVKPEMELVELKDIEVMSPGHFCAKDESCDNGVDSTCYTAEQDVAG